MYITLDKIKSHLNVDKDFTQDDDYLIHLVSSAESAVAKRLNVKSLGCLMTNQGYLPDDVCHAVLLLVGNWYANREAESSLSLSKLSYGFDFLADLNKNYKSPF